MRGSAFFLSVLLGCSLLAVCRGGEPAGPASGATPPADPAAAGLSLNTTHILRLKNGSSVRGNLIEDSGETVRLALKPYGVFQVPRREVSEIREEAGTIAVEAPVAAPDRPVVQPPAPDRGKTEQPPERDALTPPPIPTEKVAEVDYWIYHLSRQRPHWRVRAERHLKDLGPIVVGPVIGFYHRWQGPTWLYRCAALRILAEVGHPAGASTLREALHDPHPIVREVAAEGLRRLRKAR